MSSDPAIRDAAPFLRVMNTTALFAALLSVPLAVRAQPGPTRPLFEIFGTYSRPALAPSVADAYAPAGGVQPGAGVGAAVGAVIGGAELAGFFEYGSASLRRASKGVESDFTRRVGGVRIEVPLVELGGGYRGLLSGSLFVQQLALTRVPDAINRGGLITSTAPLVSVGQRVAPGARLELGVEHRGLIGTTVFVTGGVAMAGAGRGAWQDNTTRRGGVGFAPMVTVGLRTREWD
jgi:hypothetical protein